MSAVPFLLLYAAGGAPAPPAAGASEALRAAIRAARASSGLAFQFEQWQRQPPHDDLRKWGDGLYRPADDLLFLRYEATGNVRELILRRGDRGLFYDPLYDRWTDLAHRGDDLGTGLYSPTVLLRLLEERADRAVDAPAWRCDTHDGPGAPRMEAPARSVRIELQGVEVRDTIRELGYEPRDVIWDRSWACITVGLDAAGSISGTWAAGRLEFVRGNEQGLEYASVGARVRLERRDLTGGLGTTDYEGQTIDVDKAARPLCNSQEP